MFSVDNFYSYLNQYCSGPKKDTNIQSFNVHGSRLLKDIIVPAFKPDESKPARLTGQAAMFDQEPIELQYFEDWINFSPASFPDHFEYKLTNNLYKNLTPQEFIFRHFSGVHNPILCHSERNSPEVELFKQNHFHTVHYFYHGLIARDWYRHWKHYSMEQGTKSKRLGMYCRDATGSREYRLDLLHKLIPFKDDLYYNLQDPIFNIDPQLNVHYSAEADQYASDASATIVPDDCKKFDIQLVPETLFDSQKTHLTEKIFKPIVMKQPFIVIGCPNSLEYLKSYGFKTFDTIWNELYDKELDSTNRMEMIIELIETITSLTDDEYDSMLACVDDIVEHNHKHFYSEEFEKQMLDELHTNLDNAIEERNNEYESMPGGTWFMYLDKLYLEGHDITDFIRTRNEEIIKHLLTNDPTMGRQLMIKYRHLLE